MTIDLTLTAGMTRQIPATVTDADNGGPKNLTGATISWQMWVRAQSGNVAILTKTVGSGIVVDNAAAGQFTVTLSPGDTTALRPGAYPHSCVVTVGGIPEEVFLGTLTLVTVDGDTAGNLLATPAHLNCYQSLAAVKGAVAGLDIRSASGDADLMDMIAAASRQCDDFCRRQFYVSQETRSFDGQGGDTLWLPDGDDLLSAVSVKVDQRGDGSYTTTLSPTTDYRLYPYNRTPYTGLQLRFGAQFLVWPMTPAGSSGLNWRTGWPSLHASVQIAGSWGYALHLVTLPIALSGALSAGATSVLLTAGGGGYVSIGDTLRMDSEDLFVLGVAADTLTVQRGVNGSTAASHLSTAVIQRHRYPPEVEMATRMQVGRWWRRRSDAYASRIVSADSGTTLIYKGLDPDVELMLSKYRLPVVW